MRIFLHQRKDKIVYFLIDVYDEFEFNCYVQDVENKIKVRIYTLMHFSWFQRDYNGPLFLLNCDRYVGMLFT